MKFFQNIKKLSVVRTFNLVNTERSIIILLTIVIFVIINVLITSIPLRLDLSYGKAYTLSPSTKKIVQNLDDIVTIKFFASSDLPPRLNPLKSDVTDLLNEYRRTNAGKISLKTLDPKKDQKAAQEATDAGIPELQFSQVEQDKYALTTAQFGIALFYGDKKEIIPQVTDIGSLEYNVTSAIYKMTRKELPTVGIVGAPVDPNGESLSIIKELLGKQFTVENLDISTASATKEVPNKYKTLMVFDTDSKTYDSQEINALKKYISGKGKVLFFVDGVWVGNSLDTTSANHNLGRLLELYGIKINNNLLLSTTSEFVNFGNQGVQFSVPYPFWLKTNVFNPKISYFSNVGHLNFPRDSSISLIRKSGATEDELIKTTSRSWAQTNNFSLNPQTIPQPKLSDLKQYIVGAQSRLKNGGKVVVIPSSRFIQDRYLSPSTGNVAFVVNVLNDMASEGVLSGINQRAVQYYQVPDLSESQKDMFKYANILLLPVIFAVFGAIKLLRRK